MTSNGHDSARPLRTGDPRELGDYRIIGRLGRGGMGTVYLAQNPSGQKVAVKLIHPDLADDEDFRRRFAREVASARRVARFSTAGVLDARLEGEPLFIVSEYVAGPNLAEAIEADGPMAGGTLDGLAMGVAAALTAIHGAGVIHRDLKPANVLLSSVGPKVIDFGIARAMEDDGAVTRSSQLMGTPAYLAPELIEGKDITPASDIFSWGCLVAFAGTGRAPFDAPSVPAVLHQIASMAPNLEGLDPSLRELVEPALDKDPANRPTAQQLLNRLVGQEDPSDSVVDQTVVRSWTPPSTSRPVGAAATLPPPAGEEGTPAAGTPGATAGLGAAPTANLGAEPTAALPPQESPGAPPTRPYAPQGQVPSGPQPGAYGVPGQPGPYGPQPGHGPAAPLSGPQPGFGPGQSSPLYGQPGRFGAGPG
ncbi:serine/threonine-protein kinase, partial [Nocardiopsis composta]